MWLNFPSKKNLGLLIFGYVPHPVPHLGSIFRDVRISSTLVNQDDDSERNIDIPIGPTGAGFWIHMSLSNYTI